MTSYRAHALNPDNRIKQPSHFAPLDGAGPRDSETTARAATRKDATPLKIFLVEDSAILRDRLSEAFAAWGKISMVGHAETEAVADTALRNGDWDVLILDLQLLRGTGLGVLTNLAAHRRPGTVVIVLTNFAIPSYRTRSMELGADYFFDKANEFSKIRDVLGEISKRKEVHH